MFELKAFIDRRMWQMSGVLGLLLVPSLFRWFLRPFALMPHEFDLFIGLASWTGLSFDHILIFGWILHAIAWFLVAKWYLEVLAILRKSRSLPEIAWLLRRLACLAFLCVLGLPYFSADVFYYLGKGWLEVAYGMNPFDRSISEVPGFQSVEMFGNIFPEFYNSKGNYGHLFHWIAKQVSALGGGSQVAALIFFKAVALLFHFASLYAVVGIARQLRLRSNLSLWAFGANPLFLFTTLWTTHNEVLLLPCILFSVWMALVQRPALSGVFLAAGFCIKLVPLLMMPFLYLWFLRKSPRPLRQSLLFVAAAFATVAAFTTLNDGGISAYSWLTMGNPYGSVRASLMLLLSPLLPLLGPNCWTLAPAILKGVFLLTSAWVIWRTWRDLGGKANLAQPIRLVRALAWVFCFYLTVVSPIVAEWYLLWFLSFWAVLAREREIQNLKILTLFYLPAVIFCIKILDKNPAGPWLLLLGQLFLYLLLLAAWIRSFCPLGYLRRRVLRRA